MSKAKCEPGEGLLSLSGENPSPGFSLKLETTLSRKGRG
jgi:hypothetical protein